MSENPFDQFDEVAGSNPFDQFDNGNEPPKRSALGEIGTGLKRGVIGQLPDTTGKAMQWASDPNGGEFSQKVNALGKRISDSAEQRLARPDLQLNPDSHNIVTNSLAEGAEMLAPSVAFPALAAGGVALTPGIAAGSALGLGVAALAGAVPMGMGQAQSTYENVKKAGKVSDEEAVAAGWKSGTIETLGETAGTYLGGKLLGIGGKVLGKAAQPTMASALGTVTEKGLLKPFGKQLATTTAGEVTTEMGQGYSQATVEKNAGVDVDPWQQTKDVIGPTIGMTAILAPFGLAGHFRNTKKAEAIDTILADPAAAKPEERAAVVDMLHKEAVANKIPDADIWLAGAKEDILNGVPIRRAADPIQAVKETLPIPRGIDIPPSGPIQKAMEAVTDTPPPVQQMEPVPADLDGPSIGVGRGEGTQRIPTTAGPDYTESAINDGLYDFAEQSQDEQDQADARKRKNDFVNMRDEDQAVSELNRRNQPEAEPDPQLSKPIPKKESLRNIRKEYGNEVSKEVRIARTAGEEISVAEAIRRASAKQGGDVFSQETADIDAPTANLRPETLQDENNTQNGNANTSANTSTNNGGDLSKANGGAASVAVKSGQTSGQIAGENLQGGIDEQASQKQTVQTAADDSGRSGAAVEPEVGGGEPVVGLRSGGPDGGASLRPGTDTSGNQQPSDTISPGSSANVGSTASVGESRGKPQPLGVDKQWALGVNPQDIPPTAEYLGKSLGEHLYRDADGALHRSKDAPVVKDSLSAEQPKSNKKPIHDYSNTQVDIKGPAAKKITDLGKSIPDSELYTDQDDDSYGREAAPHITVRYGLGTDNPGELAELSKVGPITAKIGKVSIFETDKYDVVKAEIISDSMRAANKKVGELVDLPGETFKDYQPHATIAYVKKGEGKKYVGNNSLEGQDISFDEINLTDRTGKTHVIKLAGTTDTGGETTRHGSADGSVEAGSSYEAAQANLESIRPSITSGKDIKTAPNVVLMNVRTMKGENPTKISAPHNGTNEDALRIAKALRLYAAEEYDASMQQSETFGTDENGFPRYAFTQGQGVTEITRLDDDGNAVSSDKTATPVKQPSNKIDEQSKDVKVDTAPPVKGQSSKEALPEFAKKAGIATWKQAQRKGVASLIAQAKGYADEIVKHNVTMTRGNPEAVANKIAEEIIQWTVISGGLDSTLQGLAQQYWQKAKSNGSDPGGDQHYTAIARGVESLRARLKSPGKLDSQQEPATIKEGGISYELRPHSNAAADSRWGSSPLRTPTEIYVAEGTESDKTEKALQAENVKIGSFDHGVEVVSGPEDIAEILRPLARKAQESLMAVVLDSQLKPISILQHSVGGPFEAQVFSGHLLGSIHNTDGAKFVWFAHNHPSGITSLSYADANMQRTLDNGLRSTGVESLGHVIMGSTGKASHVDNAGQQVREFDIPPQRSGKSTDITERQLAGDPVELLSDKFITNNTIADEVLASVPDENGILLMNNPGQPIAFIPITIAQMNNLRAGGKGGIATRIYRKIDKTNSASTAIIKANAADVAAFKNVTAFLNNSRINLLDVIVNGESMGLSTAKSLRDDARNGGDVFFSKGEDGGKTAEVERELSAHLGTDGLQNLLAAGTVRILTTQDQARKIIDRLKTRGRAKLSAAFHGTPHTFPMETRVIDKNGKVVDHYVDGEIIPSDIMRMVESGDYQLQKLENGRFKTSKIGTGEGAQAYGFGLYFAGAKNVAEWYRDKLAARPYDAAKDNAFNEFVKKFPDQAEQFAGDVGLYADRNVTVQDLANELQNVHFRAESGGEQIVSPGIVKFILANTERAKPNKGKLYQVELAPQDDQYLLWDESVYDSPFIDKMQNDVDEFAKRGGATTGGNFYKYLSRKLGSDKAASEYLHSLGIRGIKYLDGSSQGKGEGNFNYVIFDENDVEIKVRYSKNGAIQGFTASSKVYLVQDGIAKGNSFAVLKHELGVHLGQVTLNNPEFQALVALAEARKDEQSRTGDAIRAAMKRVPADTGLRKGETYDTLTPGRKKEVDAIRREETLAYLVEMSPEIGIGRRLIALIKRLLVKMGISPKIFTAADLSALAEVAVRREASGKGGGKAGNADVMKSFAGPTAKQADTSALSRAKQMQKSGEARRAIWKQTGWYEIVPGSGQWSYEIDDSLSDILPENGNLHEVLNTAALFQAYPELESVKVRFQEMSRGKRGGFDRAKNTILINSKMPVKQQRSTVLHETQHYLQLKEGFSGGGSADQMINQYAGEVRVLESQISEINKLLRDAVGTPQYDKLMALREEAVGKILDIQGLDGYGVFDKGMKSYMRLAGEAEARLVQYRLDMPPAKRKAIPPWVSLKQMLKKEGLLADGQETEDVLIDRKGKGSAASEGAEFKAVDVNSPEFKRWFGDSKVVDADGKPLKVNGLFVKSDKDPPRKPKGYKTGVKLRSDILSKRPELSNADKDEILRAAWEIAPETTGPWTNTPGPYTDTAEAGEREFFLSGLYGLDEPKLVVGRRFGDIPDTGYSWNKATNEYENGISIVDVLDGNTQSKEYWQYDGLLGNRENLWVWGYLLDNETFYGGDGESLLVNAAVLSKANTPTVKSSISNTGGYSDTDSRIMYSTAAAETYDDDMQESAGTFTGAAGGPIAQVKAYLKSIGSDEMFEKVSTYFWDKDQAIERVQKGIGPQPLKRDYETLRRLLGKRVSDEVATFDREVLQPLLQHMADNKLKVADVEEYGHALHAPEANLQAKRVNARGYVDRMMQAMTDKEKAPYADRLIDIQDEFVMNDQTRNEKRDNTVHLMDQISDTVLDTYDADRAALDTELDEFNNRQWTAEELDKGTPERLQKLLANRSSRLELRHKTAQRWEDVKDRWSGMTNERALEIASKWQGDDGIQHAVDVLSKINSDRLDMLHESGELSDDEYKAIKETYEHYVPLMRDGMEDSKGSTGRAGIGPLAKPIKIRAGSTKKVVDIFANTIDLYQAAVSRKYKSEAGRALYDMVKENPNEDMWSIIEQEKIAYLDREGNIRYYTDQKEADNEVYVKIDGVKYLISVPKDNKSMRRFMDAIKREPTKLGPILTVSRYITRMMAALNTSLSPEFILTNFMRDIQTASVHLQTTDAAGMQKSVYKNLKSAIKGIYAAERGDESSDMARWYRDFSKHGGKIAWMQNYETVEDLARTIERELEYKEGKHPNKMKFRKLGKFVEAMNTSVENGVRLATYKVLVENGASKLQAAKAAANLTVDFTRHGTAGPIINSLYMFANAGIQGNVRMIKAVAKNRSVQKIAGGIVAFGFMANILGAMSGDDDDDEAYYDKLKRTNPSIFERNMVFMIPGTDGRYIKIPMPYGYNTFFVLGNEAAGALRGQSPVESMSRIMSTLLGSLNPLQSATLLQTIMPTVGDPIAQVMENKAWHGGKLMPGENPFGIPIPDSERYFKSVNPVAKFVAQGLNTITGGDKYEPGLIDMSPETFEMMVETYGGSAAKLIKDAVSLPLAMSSDDGLSMHKTPGIRKFIGSSPDFIDSTIYEENNDKVDILKKRYDDAEGSERSELRSNPLFQILPLHKTTESRLRRMNKRMKAAESAGDTETKKRIGDQMLQVKKRYNARYNSLTR